jgi:hypothetical protein
VRYPQLLVHEGDGRLAALLRDTARAARWALREPRRLADCLELLGRGGPAVLVVKLGRDLERELALLERVGWLCPDAAAVAVCETEPPDLAGLAWDLGARCVLAPAEAREDLAAVVAGLLSGPGPCEGT